MKVRTMAFVVAAMAALAPAAAQSARAGNLADLSLEELANLEITSVSRREERLSDAAASVYVITAEDLRRSGARSLPEALRLAPNLQVAQAGAIGYAVGSRGFKSSAANKLLVLIDGRSVYTPLFSGVFWDVQAVMLEDIDRIEVISGPGGTLWGVNAVNGVISITTRSAAKTQGTLIAGGAGDLDRGGAARYGGTLGEDAYFRVYGMSSEGSPTVLADGSARDDAWHRSQAGFRVDWSRSGDTLAVNGNAYRGAEAQPAPGVINVTGVPVPLGAVPFSGANVTARWERALDGGGRLALQGYLDRTERDVRPQFAETLDIVDLQVQHSLAPVGIHRPAWGAEYRRSRDRVTNSTFLFFAPPRPFFGFLPERANQTWTSLYAQDELALRDTLKLTLGARLERNDYTGNEFLPSARIAWKLAPQHLLWSAASRTVRAPSRFDRDVFVPAAPPFLLAGGSQVRSEVAKVLEAGYRGQPSAATSLSVTAFHARYDHLRSQEIDPSGTFLFFANGMEGNSKGIEAWGALQAMPRWRLSAGAVLLDQDLQPKPGSTDTNVAALGNDPTHQLTLRSSHDLSDRQELDVLVRRVGALPSPRVPAYTAFDLRYGWRLHPQLELSVTAQNLFDRRHPEFDAVPTRGEIERGLFVRLEWSSAP